MSKGGLPRGRLFCYTRGMSWLVLFVAGIFEIVWAVGLKYANGFTRLGPTLLTLVGLVASMWLLGLAVRTLPIGTAYAVWTGIGAAGTAIMGMLLLGEPVNLARMLCIALILAGIAGLKLTAG